MISIKMTYYFYYYLWLHGMSNKIYCIYLFFNNKAVVTILEVVRLHRFSHDPTVLKGCIMTAFSMTFNMKKHLTNTASSGLSRHGQGTSEGILWYLALGHQLLIT